MYPFGAVLGMLGLPALADTKGRRFTINLAFLLQIVALTFLLIGIYQNVTGLMMLGQFITGVFSSGMMLLPYIVTG